MDMVINMLFNMILDYLPFMTVILLVMCIFSYKSKKIGMIFGVIVTFASFSGSIMLIVVGGFPILIVGFLIFPTIVWIGFFLGRSLGKRAYCRIGKMSD